MSKFQFNNNEVARAAATALLTVSVAAAFFGLVELFNAPASAHGEEAKTSIHSVPHRPAGGRRWRSSNAEQSQTIINYFGEPEPWARNRVALEGAMTLFQMGGTFSSQEIAGGTLRVTLTTDYLAAYLATPFLGSDEPIAFALDDSMAGRPFVVGQVLTRSFAAEKLAQR
jgi:hypothetical protein